MNDGSKLRSMVSHDDAARVVTCTRGAIAELNAILSDIVEKNPECLATMRKDFGTAMGELVFFEAGFIHGYPDLEYDPSLVREPPSP